MIKKTDIRYLIGFIIGLLLTASCGQKSNRNDLTSNIDSTTLKSVNKDLTERKKLRDYCSDQHWYHWTTYDPDSRSYSRDLIFREDYAIYWYYGQCVYYYFTYVTSDTTLDLLWSYKTDCIIKMDLLESSHGLKNYPRMGDTFATFTQINDTSLQVKYRFPEWTRKVNKIANDSIFPVYFYLNKRLTIY